MRRLYDKKKRVMLTSLAKNDFINKYSGSLLGFVWGFIPPIVTILVYWFIFDIGFNIKPMGDVPYLIWLVSGLIPWFFFSETIIGITNCFVEYSYMVKKVVFDISIIPFVKVIASLIVHVFFLVLLFYIILLYGYTPSVYYVQLLYYITALIAFIVALGFLTATLNIFLRDIGHLVSVILQFGVWLVPILWDPSIFESKILLMLLKLNPMFYIVQGYRDSLIYNISVTSRLGYTLYFWIVIFILALLGRYVFKKMRIHFADLL